MLLANQALPLVLTVSEASLLLKMPRAKVYLFIQEGLLTAVKLRAQYRIRSDSLTRLLSSFKG